MRLRYSNLLLIALLAGAASSAHAIANGEPVSDAQFAREYGWAVAIVNEVSGGLCGGALIAPRWVVTAAHCTGMKKHVMVGDADRGETRRIEISRAIRHPEFSADTLQNDVGLLYLAEVPDIEPAAMASAAEARILLRPGAAAKIAGWGKPARGRPPAERLIEGQARLDRLEKRGSQYIYDDPNTGPCGFDSGGPMIMQTLDGRWLLVGVASATGGNICAMGGGIAVFTNLSVVRDFITDYLSQDSAE